MGIRISAYAVDVPTLDEFLAQPTGQVLQSVVEHGTDREMFVSWWEPDRGPICAIPGEAVFRVKRGLKRGYKEIIPDAACSCDPFLARVAGDFLREADSFKLKSLLRALSKCPNIGFIQEITDGYRRWWIGSLLDFTEQSSLLAPEDYARFVFLWQKVLRRYDCGKPFPRAEFDPASFDFPILPADDSDMMMGVWMEEDAYFIVDRLDRILELGPRFKAPPQMVSIPPEPDDDWNEWVHEMIRQFMVIGDILDFRRLAVVSFIG
jgi:hypothetical protein